MACPLSFSPDTAVATPERGAVPIAALQVGGRVVAFDPTTDKAGVQVVEATSITRDTDLLDVTLRVVATDGAKAAPSAPAATKGATNGDSNAKASTATQTTAREEAVHTTARHPWLTADRGWVLASHLRAGEPVRLLDRRAAMVVAARVVPGSCCYQGYTSSGRTSSRWQRRNGLPPDGARRVA